MAKCANNKCSKEVVSVKGKRARKTCSNSCRQLFLKQRVEKSKLSKVVTIAREEWERLKSLDDRTNTLINASMGRDSCGINLDEVDKIENKQLKELTPLATKTDKIENLPPVKMDGENSIDFAARKNEWKSKNG
jgi:hypothetical protein